MDESNSDNMKNEGELQSNIVTQGNSTQSGITAVQMGGQIRLVNLNEMSSVRNLVGPSRIPASTSGQPTQLLNNNQTFQLVDNATNQVIHVVNNSSQMKYPATSQILSQVRAPLAANISGNAIQMVGNGAPVLKPGSTLQLVKGQNTQLVQFGSGQTIQVVNAINGDQMLSTGNQTIQLFNPGNVPQQQLTQIMKASGSNQFVKIPYRTSNATASITNNVLQIPSNAVTTVPSIRLNVSENAGNAQRPQLLQFAINPNNQVTFIRPANTDGIQPNNAQNLRQVNPQQLQQKKLLVLGNANHQATPPSIRFSQQVIAGQQQTGTPLRFITRSPAQLQAGTPGQAQQQLTFSLLAPKQPVINTPIKDVQDIMQKMKAGVTPVMSSPQTRFVLQAGSNSGIKQAAIQVVGPGGGVDSQGSAVYILTNAPSGTALTQIATSNVPSKNANNVLKSKVLAIQPGTPKSTAQSSLTPARAALKSNRIIEQAVAKAQAGGIEIEMTESDGKKKWKRKGEFDETPESNKKKKKDTKSKVGGSAEDTMEGDLDDSNLDADKSASFRSQNKNLKKKKKLPPPSFMKKKRRKKDGQESDASDSGMMDSAGPISPYGDGQDTQDGLVPQSTRRSCRVVQRKKYVDEPDLGLSGDDSGDDFTSKKKSTSRVPAAPERNQDSQDGSVLEAQDDDSSMVIEKILSMRIVQREFEIPEDMEIDSNDPDDETMRLIDVEEFYVKYKNYSYLHCAWKTAEELVLGDKRAPMKIKRFKLKRTQQVYSQEEDEDYLFNPDYTEVDRILDMATTTEEKDGGVITLTHYLVVWKSLPYEEASWELEQDVVDLPKINAFLIRREKPSDEALKFKPRPTNKEWNDLKNSKIYKNENSLRGYQLEGLNWLTFCYYNKQNCVLADEMGLGKTIQSITFIQEVFDYGIRGPFLVVVPLSTIGNWQREFETWTSLNVVVFHGSQASKNMIQQYEMYYTDENGAKVQDAYKFNVLITTFECILSDYEVLHPIEWRVAIFDEAHRLKNRNCKLLMALQCYEFEHKVLLTGTPLQNNVDELFSLLNFLEPKQFSSLDVFMSEFGRLETESEVNKLKALLKPMMLRRLKEDVEKNLAPKEETIVEVELTNIQKKYYRAILERNFVFLAKGANSLPNLMNTMMELRKCCNHPYLITSAEEKILQDWKIEKNNYEHLFQTLVTSSGKLVLVDKLLPKLKANGHKVLIFSQMIRVLDILEDYLAHKKYPYERIDGRIRGNLRQEAIDRFSKPDSDRFVFLLCTRAGGLGINLTAADTVIIFDSDWNPQNDLQAQARCHRIGQKKSVKVYRLITRNTYEREMFDRASLKLGLDKAVLQSMGTKEMNVQNQMSKREIEYLLKKGAYGALMDDDNAGEKFCEEDIDQILQRRTQVVQIEAGVKGSTFAKASFNMSANRTDIDVDDPNFWQKWAKKSESDAEKIRGKSNLIVEMPRQRKTTSRYGKHDNIVDMSDFESSNSDSDYNDFEDEIEGKRGRKRKRGSRWGRDDRDGRYYTRSDCFKVEKTLLVYGWGRWKDMLDHARFKHPLEIDDVVNIARAMLMFSLQHYEGDEKIKKFIFDLISPEDGAEKDYKNHSGLSAPVPRGRKGKKVKKDGLKKSQFEDDLSKLDIDVDGILSDEGYRKHLARQSNKVLLRVRLLCYLKTEVIGKYAEQLLEGAHVSEISLPINSADMDLPIFWWDEEADKSLLVGVFKHGYEKYNLMRNDPCLCFLSRCGAPDERAVLAEQNSEAEELREEEEEDEQKPKKRGRKRKKFKKFKCNNDDDDDFVSYDFRGDRGAMGSDSGSKLELGKLRFPLASDMNTRLRRLITSLQRCHKQGMLKLEQVAKKLHKREQMKDYKEGESQYVSPSNLKSMRLESVGDNPLRLAEQLNWTRREETEFYRVVSTYGVERDVTTRNYIWDTFRKLAKLDKKNDDTLTEYFKAFYHMCMKVCRKFQSEDEARPPNGMYVMSITEERATRCITRINLLNKIRENILFHPRLDDRLTLCMPAPYLPSWWICGQHDKDLLVGAAKHGLSRTDYHIQFDQNLSIYKYAKQSLEEAGNAVKDEANPESIPNSPNEFNESMLKMEVRDELKEEELENEDLRMESQDGDEEKKDFMETIDGTNLCVESVKEETEVDNKDAAAGLQSTVTEEESVNGTSRLLNSWPKDRLIFHRLENICYCVEMGKWRMGHRHHNSYLSGIDLLDPSQHDYTFIQNNAEQIDSLRFRLQKKRHRRTKAEMEAEKMRSGGYHVSDNELGGIGSEIDVIKMKKHKMVNNVDCHVPVYNTVDGTRLEGEDAPTVHELDLWLDAHPDYAIERQRVRKFRLDPSRLTINECTGEENVTVINRNTGKKLSGLKAPMLMDIAEWLIKNPSFDVDPKWGPIIQKLHNFPQELLNRIYDPPKHQTTSFNSIHLSPGFVLSNHFVEPGHHAMSSATALPRIIHHPKNLIAAKVISPQPPSASATTSNSAIQSIQNFGENFFTPGPQFGLTLVKQKVELESGAQVNLNETEEIGEEVVEEEVDFDGDEDGVRCDDDDEDDDDDDDEDEDASTAPDEEEEVVE